MVQLNQISNITNTLNQFAHYLTQSGKSQKSIIAYTSDIKEYLVFNNNDLISRDSISNYKNYLLNTKKNSSTTINRKMSSLKEYNKYLIETNQLNSIYVIEKDFIKIQQSTLSPTTVTEKQVFKFIDKVKENKSYRNYVIVNILAYAGLRISECLNIKLSDIDFKEQELLVIGKGNKERTVILKDSLIELIKEYINNYRPETDLPYLFISQKCNKLDEDPINKMFNKYSNNITPHTLRHFFCTFVLSKGILDIYETAQQAGHSNINTTMRYTHPNKETIKNKLNKM